jgi:hypothetical protein
MNNTLSQITHLFRVYSPFKPAIVAIVRATNPGHAIEVARQQDRLLARDPNLKAFAR